MRRRLAKASGHPEDNSLPDPVNRLSATSNNGREAGTEEASRVRTGETTGRRTVANAAGRPVAVVAIEETVAPRVRVLLIPDGQTNLSRLALAVPLMERPAPDGPVNPSSGSFVVTSNCNSCLLYPNEKPPPRGAGNRTISPSPRLM